jgi:hypothetical protein
MRTQTGGLQFILGDHLDSASVMADSSGTLLTWQGYMPWGQTRFGGVGTEYPFVRCVANAPYQSFFRSENTCINHNQQGRGGAILPLLHYPLFLS